MITVGFIGTGTMGGTLAAAVSRADTKYNILLADANRGRAEELAAKLGAAASDNNEVAEKADYIFLGVKPQMMADMLSGIAQVLKERIQAGKRFVLITMAAGMSMESILDLAGGDYPIIRIMPNTPASIGEGVILYTCSGSVLMSERDEFLTMLRPAGIVSELPEKLIDAGMAVSSCGPAFVYIFIEALADGGVQAGIPRAEALKYAAQMTAGSARMVLESGSHPGVLKDAVCSPGGTTIEGVRKLEEGGFRGIVMDAVIAAYEKNRAFK